MLRYQQWPQAHKLEMLHPLTPEGVNLLAVSLRIVVEALFVYMEPAPH